MVTEEIGLIQLLRMVLNEGNHDGKRDWGNAYVILQKHNICNFVWEAARKDSSCPKDVIQRLHRSFLSAVKLDTVQQQEISAVQRSLESASISVIMLKGWCMKQYYPRSDLRTMADADIFMSSEDEAAVHSRLLALGYEGRTYGGKKDNVYLKKPYMTLEMHKNLFMYEDEWNKYFNTPASPMYIWNRAILVDGFQYIYQMDAELFYVYMVAHMAKHLKDDGGIGIRAFLDLYMYRRHFKESLNWDIICRDFKLLGLTTFAERAAILSDCWFSGTSDDINYPDKSYEIFANYILGGGTYGSTDYFVTNNEAMHGEKKYSSIRYLWRRAFPNRESMEKRFPELKEKRYLLPYYWCKRLWRGGFCRIAAVKSELRGVQNVDIDKVKAIHEMYEKWGLR